MFYFVVFVIVLLQHVVRIGFHRLVIAGTSVLSDSDGITYLMRQRHQFNKGHQYATKLESYIL